MSFTKVTRAGGVITPIANDTWVRPTDWLTIPDIPVGTQKIYGILAITAENVNHVAFGLNGAFTVDWGDGSAPVNYASGATAQRNIQWADISASTLTSEGYRQALVTITPQAGSNLTLVNFCATPTGFSTPFVPQWREITMRAPLLTNLAVSNQNQNNALRWFTFLGTSTINVTSVFYQARWLRGITGTQWTSSVTNLQDWFNTCYSLQTVPVLDTSSVVNMSSTFAACYSLKNVPQLNTANVTTFSNTFLSCYSLKSVPLLDTSKATSLLSMFQACISLQTVPLFNTSAVIDMTSMFNGCTSLPTVPLFDTSAVRNFTSMFNNCSTLQSVPLFNTSAGTSFTSMFAGCGCLRTVPQFDLSSGVTFNNMFQGCTALETLPTLNTFRGTSFTNFVFACVALRNVDIDLINVSSTAALNQLPSNNGNLRAILFRNLRFAPASCASLGLSAAALNDLYTSLGTASGAQTLTVTGNPGSGSSTPSIATAKGWTVVGG